MALRGVLFEGRTCDIIIENGLFSSIGVSEKDAHFNNDTQIIECKNLAIFPAFYNGHTHAAMTLFRSAGSGMGLQKWLGAVQKLERKLTAKAAFAGVRLAILEMIKSGCVFFSDMYYFKDQTIQAALSMGVRANVGVPMMDIFMPADDIDAKIAFLSTFTPPSAKISISAAPHSIYGASERAFRGAAAAMSERGGVLHTHLSETAFEVAQSLQKYAKRPAQLLDSWGVLGPSLIAAHGVHLDGGELDLMAQSGANIITCPSSNLKLASGTPPIASFLKHGVNTGAGTDGTASNDALDMHSEARLAALLAQNQTPDEPFAAATALDMAGRNVAAAYGINAGQIAAGWAADAILVDLDDHRLATASDLLASWLYAADASALHSVICGGEFLMRDKKVKDEEIIIKEAQTALKEITQG